MAYTATKYTGVSIVDYLKSVGQSSDYNSRAKLALQYGIANYTGTAEQNTQLLNTLRGGVITPPIVPTTQPPVAPVAPPAPATPGIQDYDAASVQASQQEAARQEALRQKERDRQTWIQAAKAMQSSGSGNTIMQNWLNTKVPAEFRTDAASAMGISAIPGIQDQTPEQRAAVEAAIGAPIPKTPVYAPGTPTSEITGIDTQKNADQQNYFDTINSGTPGVQTDLNKFYSQVISLLSDQKAPAAPSLLDTFNAQRAALNIGTLEGDLTSVDTQMAKLEADWAATEVEEGGRLVSMGQIKKRQSALGIEYTKQKGELETKRTRVVSQLNMKYNVLNTMITLTGKDYEIAQQEYQNKITNAIALINLIRGISEDQKDDKQRVIDNANANLTIYYNLLKEGNIKYSDLSSSVQVGITNAELLAGKPIGFAKFISETVKDPVVSNIGSYTDAEGNVFEQIMTTKSDGTYSITSVKVGTGAAVKPTKAAIDASISSIITGLEKTKGKDGYYDPDKYIAARKAFQAEYPDANVGDLDKAVTDMFSEEAKVRLRTVYGITLGGNI